MAATYTTEPIRVVDADSHLTEPPGLWVDHAPARLKDRLPRVVADNEGRPQWIVDGHSLGPIGFTAIAPDGARIAGESGGMEHRWESVHPGAYDVKARLAWLDSRGISQQLFFPNTVASFGGARIFTEVPDHELRTACVTVYNDAVTEIQQESGQRLLPFALVPWWDIDQAVKEIKRVRTDLGIRGITMCDSPQDYGLPTLDGPEWDPFWSACEDLGLAVAFHIGSSGSDWVRSWFRKGRGEFQAIITANSFLTNSWLVSNLIFSGVLLRHPRLKIFSAETGIGWMPFLLEAMDYQWQENILPDQKQDVWKGMLPSELFRRSFYLSFWFELEQKGVAHAIDAIGEDNVMFETDFPHGTALTDRVTEEVAQTLAGLRSGVRQKVLRDNAARLFDLPA
jgi:predicted TIM-barrel fold metal-dependent hydrolase